MSYNRDQVSEAFNRAADEILDAIDADDEGKRDVANAVVNVGMHYLENPKDDLETALGSNYGDAKEVLDSVSVMSRKLSEVEYEIYVLASVASAANQAIVMAGQMDDADFAAEYLFQKRALIRELLRNARVRVPKGSDK